jgi:hypothetical protein
METLDSNINSDGISEKMKTYLLETAKWAKFLAITGFIISGLTILIGFSMLFGSAMLTGPSKFGGGMRMSLTGGVYVLMTLLYFFPTLYLFQFAIKTKSSISSGQMQNLEVGFEKLKSLFKFFGIFIIVILSMYALVFAFIIIG